MAPHDSTTHTTKRMKRLTGFIIACLLLPFVWGAGAGLWAVLKHRGTSLSNGMLALALGAACMWILLAVIPRPHRLYILGHECTHALWALLTGRRVHKITVKQRRGSVSVSRPDTLVRLAPYLIPFYTLLLLAIYFLSSLFGNPSAYLWIWLFSFGASWGFHAAFTLSAIMRDQTDISKSGWLLSMVLIALVNITIIALAICAVTPATVLLFSRTLWQRALQLVTSFF